MNSIVNPMLSVQLIIFGRMLAVTGCSDRITSVFNVVQLVKYEHVDSRSYVLRN